VVAIGIAVAVAEERGLSIRGALVAGAAFGAWVILAFLANALVGRRQISLIGVLAALLLIAVVATIVYLGARLPSRRRLLAALALSAIALELFTYQDHARLSRVDVEASAPSYLAFLRAHLGDGRILNAGIDGIYPEWGAALEIPQVEMLNIAQIPAYRTFFNLYVNPAEGGRFLQIGDGDRPIPFRAKASAIDLLSVRYLVVDQHLTRYNAQVRAKYPLVFTDRRAGIDVYANPGSFPRTFLSAALVRAGKPGATSSWSRTMTRTTDQRLIADARRSGIPARATTPDAVGTAHIVGYHNDELRVQVDASKPAVLVLADTYYANWHVSVQGKAAHLARVDDIMRGVVVPAGASTVVFRYHSSVRTNAGYVSGTTIALLAVATVVGILRAAGRILAMG
jgi:hypothetical protein